MKMTLLETTKPCTVPRKFPNGAKTYAADKLNHLKKRVELQNDQAKTYAEECREKIEANQETIRKLRSEILETRISRRSARTNEFLMRKALCDHHPGSSIFREREPRDINENIDWKLSDMQNKLNKLRHARRMQNKHLRNLLNTFNETVSDVVFLELEGPMGDTRCLALENQICANDKKHMEAEMIRHTYRNIRDQLVVEGLSSQSALDVANTLLRCHEDELSMCEQSGAEAVRGKETADTEVFKTEFDLFRLRNDRKEEIADFKKQNEEEKHEFTMLWKAIQALFSAQESMPLSHMTYHSRLSISNSTELQDTSCLFEYSEDELELIKNVTGSHTVPGVAEKFEKQQSKYQYAKAFVNELEVKKAALLQKLEELNTIRGSLIHRAETEQDVLLRTASGDCRAAHGATHHVQWSHVAACRRVTQALSRLRQLLEYLAAVLVSAQLIQPPPEHDVSDTAAHLNTLLESASAGATALMASLRGADPEQVQRSAAAAAFLMTRSELHVQRPRAQLEREVAHDDIGYVGTDGDTTGDDAVPSRAAIKRQAHLILMARQKSGSRGKRK